MTVCTRGNVHLLAPTTQVLCAPSSSTGRRCFPQQGWNADKRCRSDDDIARKVRDPITATRNNATCDATLDQSPKHDHCSTHHAAKNSYVTGRFHTPTTPMKHQDRLTKTMTTTTPPTSTCPCICPHRLTRSPTTSSRGSHDRPHQLHDRTSHDAGIPPSLSAKPHRRHHRLTEGSSSAQSSAKTRTVSAVDPKTKMEISVPLHHMTTLDMNTSSQP